MMKQRLSHAKMDAPPARQEILRDQLVGDGDALPRGAIDGVIGRPGRRCSDQAEHRPVCPPGGS